MAGSAPPEQATTEPGDRASRERLSLWFRSIFIVLGAALWVGVIAFLISRLV